MNLPPARPDLYAPAPGPAQRSDPLATHNVHLRQLLTACQQADDGQKSACIKRLGEFLTAGFLPPLNNASTCEAVVLLEKAHCSENIAFTSDRWKTQHQLARLAPRVTSPDARRALEKLWRSCMPSGICYRIDADAAAAIAALHVDKANCYFFCTLPKTPLEVMLVLRLDGKSAEVTALDTLLVAGSLASQPCPNDATFADFLGFLAQLGSVPLDVSEPPVDRAMPAAPAMLLQGTKRNKDTGEYRASELARPSGSRIATVLKTSTRGGFAKVKWGELEGPSGQPGEAVAIKMMRTAEKPAPLFTPPGTRKPVRAMKIEEIYNEVTLTNRFAPALAFKYVVAVGEKHYAIQRRMAGNIEQLMHHVCQADRDVVANSVARQTAYQLWRMAARGYIHRDVKPSNVLWDGDGLVTLADFGLAVRWRENNTIGGTLHYLPPEARSATIVGDTYDVWPWAVLLVALYCDKAFPNPFLREAKSLEEHNSNIATFTYWRQQHSGNHGWFNDTEALRSPWGKTLARIRSTNQPLVDFLLAHALNAKPQFGRKDIRSVMLFTQTLQPENSVEEMRAREVLRQNKLKFADPKADTALCDYKKKERRARLI